jgi:hypothetical protein
MVESGIKAKKEVLKLKWKVDQLSSKYKLSQEAQLNGNKVAG